MDDNQNDKTLKKEKHLSPHDKVKDKVEENIFRMANGRFMVVVQKRINGKVRTKKNETDKTHSRCPTTTEKIYLRT
jgi:hypothetical protein